MEEFVAALPYVKELYAERQDAKNQRFMLRSTADANGAWVITCTDCIDRYWEKEFRYDEAAKIKAASESSAGVDSWELYFKRFADAFSTENMFVGESPALCTLTTWAFLNGKQQSYIHKLPAVTKDSHKKIADFSFHLLAHLKRLRGLEHELRKATREIKMLRDELDHAREAGGGEAKGNVARSKNLKVKPAIVKRKQNMSLVNPAVKRHIPKGARITSEESQG